MRRVLMLVLAGFLSVVAKAGAPPPVVPYHLAYRAGMFYAVPNTPHSADQVASAIYDSVNNAIRINATPVPPGTTQTPHDLNQTILSIYDSTNNAIYVNCVTGCSGGGGGSVLLAPSSDQTITGAHKLILSDPLGQLLVGSASPITTGEGLSSTTTSTRTSGAIAGLDTLTTVTPTINSGASGFGLASYLFLEGTHNYGATQIGNYAQVEADTTGTLGVLQGYQSFPYNAAGASATKILGFSSQEESDAGTVTDLVSLESAPVIFGGTVSNRRGVWVRDVANSGATITNNYGIYIDSLASGSNNVAINVAGAQPIQIGSTTVGALPAAGAGNAGQVIMVTDSTTIVAEGQTCAGTGSVKALAFSNGSSWKCF